MIKATFVIQLTFFISAASTNLVAAEGDDQKAILVTGASTGIGRNMAETLAAEGVARR